MNFFTLTVMMKVGGGDWRRWTTTVFHLLDEEVRELD